MMKHIPISKMLRSAAKMCNLESMKYNAYIQTYYQPIKDKKRPFPKLRKSATHDSSKKNLHESVLSQHKGEI